MSKKNKLDALCDEMDIKEKEYHRLTLGWRRLEVTINAFTSVKGMINDKDRIYQTRKLLSAMYNNVIADHAKVEDQLDELAMEFDRLVDEYFKETGKYYYPERDEWPEFSSIRPSWMKASRSARTS